MINDSLNSDYEVLLAKVKETEEKLEEAEKEFKLLTVVERPVQNIGPAFEHQDLSTKANLLAFCEKWRTKLVVWHAGKQAMLLVWVNLEWSIWESMRLIGGANIPPEPPRERRAILKSLDAVIDWCQSAAAPKPTKRAWIGPAIVCLKDDPTLTNAAIASKVGIHPSQMSRSKEWQSIRDAASKVNAANIPRGTKYCGKIDAVDDGD